MKINFTANIETKKSKKDKSGLLLVIQICVGVLLLVSLFQLIVGGPDDVNWVITVIAPILFLIYFKFNYNTTPVSMEQGILNVKEDGLYVDYLDIDRLDGKGKRTEKIYIPYNELKRWSIIKLSNELMIEAIPIITDVYEGKEPEIRPSSSEEVIYEIDIPTEKAEEFIQYVNDKCPVKLEVIE